MYQETMTKLIAFDMDGVILKHRNFWMELHKEFGTLEEGKILTDKYLRTDYGKLVKEVIGRLWAGKPAKTYFDLINQYTYIQGAKKTFEELKKLGHKVIIITAGPYHLALKVKEELGADYIFANNLPIKDGVIVGTEDMDYWKIQDDRKVEPFEEIRKKYNIQESDTVAVIHDKNDIALGEHVKSIGGKVIGFMFEPHPEVEEHCTQIVRSQDLADILEHI